MFTKFVRIALLVAVVAMPVVAGAAGGGGGGGGSATGGGATFRLTGLCTAIDTTNRTMIVGQLYYGNGAFRVSPDVKVSINQTNGSFTDVQLGDLCEVRYDSTRTILKIAVTR